MGLVEVEDGVVACGQRGQRRHVGAVAVHAEDRFGDDETEIAGMRRQQFVEMGEVVVAEADLPQTLAAGVQAGVVEAVGEDERLCLPSSNSAGSTELLSW